MKNPYKLSLGRLLSKASILLRSITDSDNLLRFLYFPLRRLTKMAYKQVYITLDQTVLEQAKDKSANIERRSLNSQARILFDNLPLDREFLFELGIELKKNTPKSLQPEKPVSLTFRITEEELWDWKEKALLARMNPRELVASLLELWNAGDLESIMETIRMNRESERMREVK